MDATLVGLAIPCCLQTALPWSDAIQAGVRFRMGAAPGCGVLMPGRRLFTAVGRRRAQFDPENEP